MKVFIYCIFFIMISVSKMSEYKFAYLKLLHYSCELVVVVFFTVLVNKLTWTCIIGQSKKLAKAAAARAALSSLYDLSFNSACTPNQSLLQPTNAATNVPCVIMPSHQADVIARYYFIRVKTEVWKWTTFSSLIMGYYPKVAFFKYNYKKICEVRESCNFCYFVSTMWLVLSGLELLFLAAMCSADVLPDA